VIYTKIYIDSVGKKNLQHSKYENTGKEAIFLKFCQKKAIFLKC